MKEVHGIILRRIFKKEADTILEVYTKDAGLVYFQAKGVRKAEAKLKFRLDTFNLATIYYASSRYLPIIVDAKVEDRYSLLRQNLDRLRLANTAGHIISNIFESGFPDGRIWQEVLRYFNSLNDNNFSLEELSQLAYLTCYRFLSLGGFDPELVRCTVCLKPIFLGRLNISLINGGLVHNSCTAKSELSLDVARDVLYLVQDMKKGEPVLVLNQRLKEDVWSDFKKLTQFFFQYYFGLDISKLV